MKLSRQPKGYVDHCVLCRKDTGYTTDTPIGARRYYIEGGGQLCEACYRSVLLQQIAEEKARGWKPGFRKRNARENMP